MATKYIVVRRQVDDLYPMALDYLPEVRNESGEVSKALLEKWRDKKVLFMEGKAKMFKSRKAAEEAVRRTLEIAKDFKLTCWAKSSRELIVVPVEV